MSHFEAGKRMKTLRLQSGISQDELAALTQLSLRTIQRIENGETAPRGDSLKRIANALQINIGELTTIIPIENNVVSILKEDKTKLLLLNAVAFGFFITPLLGIFFPMIIWIAYKDKIRKINKVGKQIIKFQLCWCILLFSVYGYIFGLKFFHISVPIPTNDKALVVFIAVLYIFNTLVVLINFFQYFEIKKNFNPLILKTFVKSKPAATLQNADAK